jgi:hypothetical protein
MLQDLCGTHLLFFAAFAISLRPLRLQPFDRKIRKRKTQTNVKKVHGVLMRLAPAALLPHTLPIPNSGLEDL